MIREEIIKSLPLHTRYRYIHPINYYQTGQVDTKAGSSQSAEKAGISQTTEDSLKSHEGNPYPWLDEDDPRRDMTDEEILDKYVDLTNSDLTSDEKGTVMRMIKDHKQGI